MEENQVRDLLPWDIIKDVDVFRMNLSKSVRVSEYACTE